MFSRNKLSYSGKNTKGQNFPWNVKGEERNMEGKTITRSVINVYKHQRSNETEIASGLNRKNFSEKRKNCQISL